MIQKKCVVCSKCHDVVYDGTCECNNVAIRQSETSINIYVDDTNSIEFMEVILNTDGRIVYSEKIFMYPMVNLKEIRCQLMNLE